MARLVVLHIYDVQRDTGNLYQATSVLCVCVSRGTGHKPSKVELDGLHLLQGIAS